MGDKASWRVLQSVGLEEVIGRDPDTDAPLLRGFVATRGTILRDVELNPHFVSRYDDEESVVRSFVERIEEEEDGGELKGYALDERVEELGIDASKGGSRADGSMTADEKREAVAAAEKE